MRTLYREQNTLFDEIALGPLVRCVKLAGSFGSEMLANGELTILKFRRDTIRAVHWYNPPRGSPRRFASQSALRGCLSGLCGVSPRALRVSPSVLRGSAGVHGIFRGFSGVVTLCL